MTRILTLYVDGVPVPNASSNPPGGPPPLTSITTNPFYIGYSPNYGGSFFRGALDEVRIYNRVLTLAEIQGLAQ